jgi:ABC-type phosphate transport system ATPase subunit
VNNEKKKKKKKKKKMVRTVEEVVTRAQLLKQFKDSLDRRGVVRCQQVAGGVEAVPYPNKDN